MYQRALRRVWHGAPGVWSHAGEPGAKRALMGLDGALPGQIVCARVGVRSHSGCACGVCL